MTTLRRELKMQGSHSTNGKQAKLPTQVASGPGSASLTDFLKSPEFLVQGDAVGKFVTILSWLYRQNPKKFDGVLTYSGRKRQYFGRTATQLEQSGNSVMPRSIPTTPYWVVSNNDTPKKKRMLEDVMRMLGYDPGSTAVAVDAVR
jgi:negative modulator of initiation of replication